MSSNVGRKYAWKTKPQLEVVTDPVVQNEWVTLCDLKGGIQVEQVIYGHDNSGHTQQTGEFRVTLNGNVHEVEFDDPADTNHSVVCGPGANGEGTPAISAWQSESMSGFMLRSFQGSHGDYYFLPESYECHSIKIEYRMTSVGIAQTMWAAICYKKLEAV